MNRLRFLTLYQFDSKQTFASAYRNHESTKQSPKLTHILPYCLVIKLHTSLQLEYRKTETAFLVGSCKQKWRSFHSILHSNGVILFG